MLDTGFPVWKETAAPNAAIVCPDVPNNWIYQLSSVTPTSAWMVHPDVDYGDRHTGQFCNCKYVYAVELDKSVFYDTYFW